MIQPGDFVFCLGDGMSVFPVAHVDNKHEVAYLNPAVDGIGTGGRESLHKLELVRESKYATRFPQFCKTSKRGANMNAQAIAEQVLANFNRTTEKVSDEVRWDAAEELISSLEGVLMERDELQQ